MREALWLRQLLIEMDIGFVAPVKIRVDNQSAIKLAENPVQQQAGDSVTFIARDAFYSDEETDEIFAHLRALGYVD